MGLDTVELLLNVEKHFEIAISDAEATQISTVGDLRDIVCTKLKANGWRANPELILREVSDLISEQMGIPVDKIAAASRITEDLKID